MAFLLPIPVMLILGLVWVAWASRPPRPADPATTVEEWSRALRVLGAQPPARPAERRDLARST